MKRISADRVKLALTLFLSYLKIGLFTFGGGYAMIALIEREFVVRKKWINEVELYEIIAIAESTPGPIAINCATFVGYKMLGFIGSFLATLAVCIPSFAIIYLISIFYDAFMSLTAVAYAFEGVKVGIAIMVTTAGVNMLRKADKNAFSWGIFLLTFAAAVCIDIFSLNFSTVYIILIGAALGLIAQIIRDIIAKKKGLNGKQTATESGNGNGDSDVKTGMAAEIICRDGENSYGMGKELRKAVEGSGEKSVSVEEGGKENASEQSDKTMKGDLPDTGTEKSVDENASESQDDAFKNQQTGADGEGGRV